MVGMDDHSFVYIADDRSSYSTVLSKEDRYGHRRLYRYGHRTVCDCTETCMANEDVLLDICYSCLLINYSVQSINVT